jgi:hypothetical protein
MCFQQMLEAVEGERWDEAAMALFKLYAIEEGETFADLQESVDLDEAISLAA